MMFNLIHANMKKTIFILCALFSTLGAQAQMKYDVTVEGASGNNIYLVSLEERSVLGQQTPDEKGTVHFTGEAKEPTIVALSTTNNARGAVAWFILDEAATTLTVDATDAGIRVKDGSDISMKYNNVLGIYSQAEKELRKVYMEYSKLMREHNNKVPTSLSTDLKKQQEAIRAEEKEALKKVMAQNTDNLIPLAIILKDQQAFETSFLKEFLSSYTHSERPSIVRIKQQIEKDALKEVGASVKDFTMKDPEGKDVHLTDWVGKGKYVLVDYWASWCGPCRREMPHVKAAYEKYSEKGFEIVGVSFDNKHEDWVKGISELGITWPQMSDLKGWQCLASDMYNIKSIPATILYDPEGKVVATNLRGQQLLETLEKHLGK